MKAQSKTEQREVLFVALPYMPKPCIIYVDERNDAYEIYNSLIEIGYRNIGIFIGSTKQKDRQALLKEWEENRLDIMVANSAFGMGVDKANIRSIFHCYVPENFNRLYQEAGRAGRDGANAINFWIYTDENIMAADKKHNSDVLTQESIEARWNSVLHQRIDTYENSTIIVTMDAVRDALIGTITGEQNRTWNESMLLIFARYGLVKIVDIEKVNNVYQFTLKLNNEIFDKDRFVKIQENIRQNERNIIDKEFELVNKYLGEPNSKCISDIICEIYGYSGEIDICGGCPSCHSLGIYSNRKQEAIRFTQDDEKCKQRSSYIIYRSSIIEKVKEFINKGIRYFLVQDNDIIVQIINDNELANEKFMVLLLNENNENAEWNKIISNVCVAFYKNNKRKVYQYITRNSIDTDGEKLFEIIHIIDEDFECENNRLMSQNYMSICWESLYET